MGEEKLDQRKKINKKKECRIVLVFVFLFFESFPTNIAFCQNTLDKKQEIINYGKISGGSLEGDGLYQLFSAGRFPFVTNLKDSSDPFQSPDALYIGGLPSLGWNWKNGTANNNYGRPGSLVITGQPWGPYNAATLLSLLTSTDVDAQNGVCAIDWRNGPGHYCGFDGVAQYIGATNPVALIVANVQFFTENSVLLNKPLLSDEIKKLRVGMYISTNIINSDVPVKELDSWGNLKTPQQNFYTAIITGWSNDGRKIQVSGWDIPRSQKKKNRKVPMLENKDTLDRWFSNYRKPVVFIGNSLNMSAQNEYIDYKGYKAGDKTDGSTAINLGTAPAHMLAGNEIDLRYWASRPNEVHLDGITVSIASDPGSPIGREGLSKDSYMMALSGDIHNVLELDGPDDGNIILSHSFYLHGQQGVRTTSGEFRTVQTLFGFTGEVDGMSAYNLMGWLKKDKPSIVGTDGASFHLGIVKNGYAFNLDPSKNGLGEIVWNDNANNIGGLSLCGSNGECGLQILSSGIVLLKKMIISDSDIVLKSGARVIFSTSKGLLVLRQDEKNNTMNLETTNQTDAMLNVKGNISSSSLALKGYKYKSLPEVTLDGLQVWCSDCELNGVKGLPIFWHAGISKWTDSQNHILK